jgi:hypothetical protein
MAVANSRAAATCLNISCTFSSLDGEPRRT